jgi:biopolymer transport protein ExbD
MPRIPLAVACLFLVAACAAPPRLQLPTVGTVGDLPPATDTLTLEMQRDGTLSCDGRTVSLAELAALVEREAATRLGTKIQFLQTSDLKVVIAADGELPFGALAPVHVVLFRSNPAVYQVFYAVRSESDGEPGALALFLPHDIGGHLLPWRVPVPIRVGADAGASAPAALLPHVADLLRTSREGFQPPVAVAAANDPHFAFVLRVADAILRAGTDDVVLEWLQGMPDSRFERDTSRSMVDRVRAIGPVQQATSIRFGDEQLAAKSGTRPGIAIGENTTTMARTRRRGPLWLGRPRRPRTPHVPRRCHPSPASEARQQGESDLGKLAPLQQRIRASARVAHSASEPRSERRVGRLRLRRVVDREHHTIEGGPELRRDQPRSEGIRHLPRVVAEHATAPGTKQQGAVAAIRSNGQHIAGTATKCGPDLTCTIRFAIAHDSGVGCGRGDDRCEEQATGPLATIHAKPGHARRMDEVIRVEGRSAGPIGDVVGPLGQQGRKEAGAAAQVLFLSLRSIEESATWIPRRCEVEQQEIGRAFVLHEPSRRRLGGFGSHLDPRTSTSRDRSRRQQ